MAKRKTGIPSWIENENRWRLSVRKDGIRKVFYSSTAGRAGMLECREKADNWLQGKASSSNPFVRDVFEEWLNEVDHVIGSQSARMYRQHGTNYILPAIGHLHVDRLTNEQMFQKIINAAYQNSISGKSLSRQTLSNLRTTISGFLKYCRKCGYTNLHPENLTLPRKAAKPDKKILQPEDIRILFSLDTMPIKDKTGNETTVPEWFIHVFRFGVLTGMRPGEILGLHWKDIDNNILNVSRSINYKNEITEGKNENARRPIVLTKHALKVLEDQRTMLRDTGVDSEYVFPRKNGDHTTHWDLERHLKKYCSRNNITVVTPYELRHTFISINKSLPSELVKRYAGHSDSMDTFGVYGHEVNGEMDQTAELLEGVMLQILEDNSGADSGANWSKNTEDKKDQTNT